MGGSLPCASETPEKRFVTSLVVTRRRSSGVRRGGEGSGARERPRLGQLLCASASLDVVSLEAALAQQQRNPLRLGSVLTANGWSSSSDVARALAQQRGLGWVDLGRSPPDEALLAPELASVYLKHGILPWRRSGGVTTYAVTDPEHFSEGLSAIGRGPRLACAVVTTRDALETAVASAFPAALAQRAALRTPPALSVRGIPRLRLQALALVALVCALLFLGGEYPPMIACCLLFLLSGATTVLRIAALLMGRRGAWKAPPPPEPAIALSARRPLPKVSLLVPLYREAGMIDEIRASLERLDYPRESLEVRLLLEEDDTPTREAVDAADLPVWIQPLTIPPGGPRTKPRALNYALDFCTGDIVGILDAEDRPDPGQLREVARAFAEAPQSVACAQCQLSYHNATENWISRCFQIEYSIWFDVLLRGWQAIGLPVPLGGTSVYFRRTALETVGGWDAHNVTEDADLGMRLARHGLSCAVLDSRTEEEANAIALRWIRQRSRWLKGYLLTWASHMRAPAALWRDLGPLGFLGLNVLFLGGAVSYLAMPLFWLAMFGWLVAGESVLFGALPGWALWPTMTMLAVGQLVMVLCAGLAMVRRETPGLIWWVPLMPVYWTLGAAAAWKAVLEIVVAPFWWDKTRHGVSRSLRDAPLALPAPVEAVPELPWYEKAIRARR